MKLTKIAIMMAAVFSTAACAQEAREQTFKNADGKVLEGNEALIAKLEAKEAASKTNTDRIKERNKINVRRAVAQKQRRGEALSEEEQLILKEGASYLNPEERRELRQEYRKAKVNQTKPPKTNGSNN